MKRLEVIPGATTDTYTPVTADDGEYLRATATYTDITSDPDDPDTVNIDERTQKVEDERWCHSRPKCPTAG